MSNQKQPARTWSMVLSLGIPLTVVGVAAMLITFATLIDVARINGLPFPEVFPVVVDVGMVAAMITATQFRLRGIEGRWLAYAAFIVLSLVSVVANGTHAQQAANLEQTTLWAAWLIGAVPSATLLVITHLVMKLIPDAKERQKLHSRREKVEAARERQGAAPQQAAALPAPGADAGPREPLRLVSESRPAPAASRPAVKAEVRERVLEHIAATGKRPTGSVVGEWLGGKSSKTGQRFLNDLEDLGELDTPEVPLTAASGAP